MTPPLFLLDTNICVYILQGGNRPAARAALLRPGEAVISAISLGELARGPKLAGPVAPGILARFTSVFPVIAFDEKAALRFAALPLRRDRFDRLIAAQALTLGLTLVTNNEADFLDVPGLKTENWTLA